MLAIATAAFGSTTLSIFIWVNSKHSLHKGFVIISLMLNFILPAFSQSKLWLEKKLFFWQLEMRLISGGSLEESWKSACSSSESFLVFNHQKIRLAIGCFLFIKKRCTVFDFKMIFCSPRVLQCLNNLLLSFKYFSKYMTILIIDTIWCLLSS